MSAHTSGRVVDKEVLVAFDGPEQHIGVEVDGVEFVARVSKAEIGHPGGIWSEKVRRIAPVLAAAPDMLTALIACRRQMQNDWHNKPRIGMEAECALADAAIAKARGK